MSTAGRVGCLFVVVSSLPACKESTHGPRSEAGDGESVVVAKQSQEKAFYAADADYLAKNADFFFRVWDKTFTTRLDDLPTTGEVPDASKPHSGYWYPESLGGTGATVSGNESPLQKYDDAFHGGQDKAAAWEKSKHNSTVEWAGHCNGMSAAAQRFPQEPKQNVTRNGVTFTPLDIKALLAEIHMSADYEFLGGNRCEQAAKVGDPLSRKDPTVMDECEDINPGTLHAAVTNWIGRMHQTMIMDQYQGDEVWNFPFFKYEVTSIQKDLSATQARQYVVGSAGGYVFNPHATKFAYVKMRLTYVNALGHEATGQRDEGVFNLTYVLELNASGEIVGGEWTGQSVQNHPDFMWIALEPQVGNGTRYMGNPNLDPDNVISLWAEGAGVDPKNIPNQIKRPVDADNWGKWPAFDVTLDGSTHGAVFAGKKTHVHITRRNELAAAGVTVALLLNGIELTKLTGNQSDPMEYDFDPGIGMNRLELLWKKSSTTLADEYLRFHVVR